jgi:nitrogen-specific signal transduction histidine kinase/ActR/RegA family two-component response regulator
VAFVVWAGLDVTDQRVLEDQLRQSQKMQSIGRLAGGIAHDFNNLLTVIIGYGDLLLRQIPTADPLRANVQQIQTAAERAARLTGQLLAFSRRQVLLPTVLDLNSLVEESEKMLRRLIGEDIRLETRFEHKPARIKADPGQIEQVILNLAINARDAMPEGGSLAIATSSVSLDPDAAQRAECPGPGRYTRLEVTDSGCGMSEETLEHLFEPFFTTKEAGRGTGLGLSMVYGFVHQTGGGMEVTSRPGRGSTFFVYFPEVKEALPPVRIDDSAALEVHSRARVLLVEDEDSVRALAQRILESMGLGVVPARSGEEAIELFETHGGAFDLLLTDAVLPGLSGPEVAERLLKQRPGLRTLFMSGYFGGKLPLRQAVDSGHHFLQKPFSVRSLSESVQRALEKPESTG